FDDTSFLRCCYQTNKRNRESNTEPRPLIHANSPFSQEKKRDRTEKGRQASSIDVSLRQTDSPHQVVETRIAAQGRELRPHVEIHQVEASFLVRFFQPVKRLFRLSKSGINCGELKGRHIGNHGKLLQFVKYSVCLVSFACLRIGVAEGCDHQRTVP